MTGRGIRGQDMEGDVIAKIDAGKLAMHYDQEGTGEPLILIPYLAADYACYAFQVGAYCEALHVHLSRPPRDG